MPFPKPVTREDHVAALRRDQAIATFAKDIARQCVLLDRMQKTRAAAEAGDKTAERRLLDAMGRPWEARTRPAP